MRAIRPIAALAVALLMSGVAARAVAAQVIERPVAFDTLGQVTTISPALAARFALSAPAWPVVGSFVDARLYDLGNGRFVIAVQRAGGVIERYEISAEARAALQQAVASGIPAGSLVSRDRQDVEFEPAASAFVRNQTLLGALVYGPAAAAVVDGGSGAGALYFAGVGASFFTSLAISRNQPVTKAQNRLATNLGVRGALIGWGTKYALAGDTENGSVAAGAILAGGVLGSIIGFKTARSLTNSEANAATFGSTFATLTTAGVIGALGGWQEEDVMPSQVDPYVGANDNDEHRAEVGGLVVAAVAGYPMGLAYARHASYGITAGDIGTLTSGGVIGVLGSSALLGDNTSDEAGAAAITAGYVLGTFISGQAFAKPYDLTEGEGRLIGLGAIAGGLIAIAVPTLAESGDGQLISALAAAGGAAGMLVTRNMLSLERVDRRFPSGGGGDRPSSSSARRDLTSTTARNRALTLSLHAANAALLLARPRRNTIVPLATLTF